MEYFLQIQILNRFRTVDYSFAMDRLSIKCFAALVFLQVALLVNGECDHVASTSWRSGHTAQFKVRIPKDAIRWEMDVTFSSPVASLKTGDAASSTHDNVSYHLISHSHRLGKDVAELDVSYAPTGPAPKIISIIINGKNQCKVSTVPHLKSSMKPKVLLPSNTSSKCKNRTKSSTSREFTLKPSTTMPALATKMSSTTVVTKAASPPSTNTKTVTTTRTITKALKPRTSTVTKTVTTTIQPTTLTTTVTTSRTIQVTTTMTASPPTPILCASPHILPEPLEPNVQFESSTSEVTPTLISETVALMSAAAESQASEESSDNDVLLQPSIVPEELQPFAELVTTWHGGYALNLHIHFPYQAAEWVVDVDFSQRYECIAIEGADVLDMSGDGFTVFGSSPQSANSTYDAIKVNVAYDPAHPTPILRQVLLNYVPITYYTSKLNLKRSGWNTTQIGSVRQLPSAQTQTNCTGCCKCSYDVQCACKDATVDPSRSCRSIISSSHSSSVHGAFDDHVTIDLSIPFTAAQIWEIAVIFSAPVDNLEATDFTIFKITDTQFGLLTSNVAEHPCPNSVHSLRLMAQYSQTKPQIIAVGMNNQTLCSAA